ncbi:MAG: hypothetical protein MJZ30_03265 [Paludibacteraceae bacterium]|nr:hypothetical protein [Paludibacteraceae bacterium]
MAAYSGTISLKQFCHLVYGKPYGLFLKLYLKSSLSIFRLVENYLPFIIFVHDRFLSPTFMGYLITCVKTGVVSPSFATVT